MRQEACGGLCIRGVNTRLKLRDKYTPFAGCIRGNPVNQSQFDLGVPERRTDGVQNLPPASVFKSNGGDDEHFKASDPCLPLLVLPNRIG